jgi:hypothetical protein
VAQQKISKNPLWRYYLTNQRIRRWRQARLVQGTSRAILNADQFNVLHEGSKGRFGSLSCRGVRISFRRRPYRSFVVPRGLGRNHLPIICEPALGDGTRARRMCPLLDWCWASALQLSSREATQPTNWLVCTLTGFSVFHLLRRICGVLALDGSKERQSVGLIFFGTERGLHWCPRSLASAFEESPRSPKNAEPIDGSDVGVRHAWCGAPAAPSLTRINSTLHVINSCLRPIAHQEGDV